MSEKGQSAKERMLTLRGDQNAPEYLKLNPKGVVPTLVHDGRPIVESSLILYYIDDVFPDPPLIPNEPRLRHRVRLFNKLIDEYQHNACTILTFRFPWPQRGKCPSAVHASKELALQALLIDPVISSSFAAMELPEELWTINQPHIPKCM